MSRFLQVLEIFEIWMCHIFELCWLPKVTSILRKQLTDRDGVFDNNKFYVKIIDNFYVIITSRRKLDVF